jgi:hypothetical protein
MVAAILDDGPEAGAGSEESKVRWSSEAGLCQLDEIETKINGHVAC